MPAALGRSALALLALAPQVFAAAELGGASGNNPCQAGSVPYQQCNFQDKTSSNYCFGGVNTGQNAKSNPNCKVPSPQNGCALVKPGTGQNQNFAWMWMGQNQWGPECCNCFQQSVCPSGSVKFQECSFSGSGGSETCMPGVNTGALATPAIGNVPCTVPSPANSCEMQVNQATMAWWWTDPTQQVECCNCFQLESIDNGNSGNSGSSGSSGGSSGGYQGGSWAQKAAGHKAAIESHAEVKSHASLKSRLRHAPAEHGDEAASMLQLPVELQEDAQEEENAEL